MVGLSLVTACATPLAPITSEEAVWVVVEARNQAWVRNDEQACLSIHHPDYSRWNRREMRLETKSDVRKFWVRVRQNELSISVEVEPVSVQFLAQGRVAIAHYAINEKVEFVGRPFVQRGEMRFEPGDTAVYRIRFSDVYELSEGKWRYVGGAQGRRHTPQSRIYRGAVRKRLLQT